MCPPPAKYKSKKETKKSKKDEERDVNRDPSHWEYVKGSYGKSKYKKIMYKTNWKSIV